MDHLQEPVGSKMRTSCTSVSTGLSNATPAIVQESKNRAFDGANPRGSRGFLRSGIGARRTALVSLQDEWMDVRAAAHRRRVPKVACYRSHGFGDHSLPFG